MHRVKKSGCATTLLGLASVALALCTCQAATNGLQAALEETASTSTPSIGDLDDMNEAGSFSQDDTESESADTGDGGLAAGAFRSKPELAEMQDTSTEHRGLIVFFVGLHGAGKRTLAEALKKRVQELQPERKVVLRVGEAARAGLAGFGKVGLSAKERNTQVVDALWEAQQVALAGGVGIVADPAPLETGRSVARFLADEAAGRPGSEQGFLNEEAEHSEHSQLLEQGAADDSPTSASVSAHLHPAMVVVHVATPPAACADRDPEGLHALAAEGKLRLPGATHPFEHPDFADLVLDANATSVQEAVGHVVGMARHKRAFPPLGWENFAHVSSAQARAMAHPHLDSACAALGASPWAGPGLVFVASAQPEAGGDASASAPAELFAPLPDPVARRLWRRALHESTNSDDILASISSSRREEIAAAALGAAGEQAQGTMQVLEDGTTSQVQGFTEDGENSMVVTQAEEEASMAVLQERRRLLVEAAAGADVCSVAVSPTRLCRWGFAGAEWCDEALEAAGAEGGAPAAPLSDEEAAFEVLMRGPRWRPARSGYSCGQRGRRFDGAVVRLPLAAAPRLLPSLLRQVPCSVAVIDGGEAAIAEGAAGPPPQLVEASTGLPEGSAQEALAAFRAEAGEPRVYGAKSRAEMRMRQVVWAVRTGQALANRVEDGRDLSLWASATGGGGEAAARAEGVSGIA